MAMYYSRIGAGLALVLGCFYHLGAEHISEQAQVIAQDGTGIEVRLKRACALNGKCPLTIALWNEGNKKVVVTDRGYLPCCRVTIVNQATGTPVALTIHGESTVVENPQFGGSQAFVKLGAQRRIWSHDMRKCFALGPGHYQLGLRVFLRVDGKGAEIAVEPVDFEITSQ
jgi:hypothetical protein